jgi:hypothetical protein
MGSLRADTPLGEREGASDFGNPLKLSFDLLQFRDSLKKPVRVRELCAKAVEKGSRMGLSATSESSASAALRAASDTIDTLRFNLRPAP